ncbi:hypothetical protein [Dyella sp.]|uniref:hypothetical protein n=1 Tax=Dyella sp. TaxID=1869338 RepID=UPI002D7991A4|nr:hypothetical protein [Dyella sp.]HET7331673.1 hypothetical protein [Dyella sp.]
MEQVGKKPTKIFYIPPALGKTVRHVFLIVAVLSLYACASVPGQGPGISSDVLDRVHKEGVKTPVVTTSDFKEQTKGKVAAATALSIAGAVLGGGQIHMGQRNQKPVEGYTVTQGRVTVFSESERSEYLNVGDAMNEALHRKLVGAGVAVSDTSSYAMTSVQKFWGIDYEKMSEKDNYRLYYNIQTSLMEGRKTIRTYTCAGVTEDMGGYAYWADDDKKNVKLHAAIIGDICADKALAAFGLSAEKI